MLRHSWLISRFCGSFLSLTALFSLMGELEAASMASKAFVCTASVLNLEGSPEALTQTLQAGADLAAPLPCPACVRITLLRRGCDPVTWYGRINLPPTLSSAAVLSPAVPAMVFARSGTTGSLQYIEAHKTYSGLNATAPTSEQLSYACNTFTAPSGPGSPEAPPEAFQATLKVVNQNSALLSHEITASYLLNCREDQSEDGTRRVQLWNELERFRASEHADRELGYIGIGDQQFDMSSFTDESAASASAMRARQALAVGAGLAAGAAAHHALPQNSLRRLPRVGPILQLFRRAPLGGSLR